MNTLKCNALYVWSNLVAPFDIKGNEHNQYITFVSFGRSKPSYVADALLQGDLNI